MSEVKICKIKIHTLLFFFKDLKKKKIGMTQFLYNINEDSSLRYQRLSTIILLKTTTNLLRLCERVNGQLSESFSIKKGIRHDGLFSPIFCLTYLLMTSVINSISMES